MDANDLLILVCPIWIPLFPVFFNNVLELGNDLDPVMASHHFQLKLDERRFEPTTFQSSSLPNRPDFHPIVTFSLNWQIEYFFANDPNFPRNDAKFKSCKI